MTRMTRRLLVGAIVVLIPALAGCEAGANAPTSEFHPAAFGGYQTQGDVTINNAFVLGAPLNQTLPADSDAGLFLAMYSTNHDQLTSITTSAAASVTLINGPVTLPGYTSVNLTGPAPEIVLDNLTAPLVGGQNIKLTLTFAKAGSTTFEVPVQPQTDAYATYAQPASPSPSPSPTATSTASPTGTATASPTGTSTASATGTVTASPTTTASTTAKHRKRSRSSATESPSPTP